MPLSGPHYCHLPLNESGYGGAHTLPTSSSPRAWPIGLGRISGQAGTSQEVSKALGDRNLLSCRFLIWGISLPAREVCSQSSQLPTLCNLKHISPLLISVPFVRGTVELGPQLGLSS